MAGEGGGGFYNRDNPDLYNQINPGFFNQTVNNQPKKPSAQTQAAEAIQQGLDKATSITEQGSSEAQAKLDPYRKAGLEQLNQIQDLLTPTGQNDFITKNPFFEALSQDAARQIFNKTGAAGKGFSGGTAQALQNSILLLGNDLVNQNINQRSGIADLGYNASTGQANIGATSALNLADIAARGGETQAAGILGLENTRRADKAASRDSRNNLISTGITLGALALSDRRFKKDIHYIGKAGNVPCYFFRYKGSKKLEFGTMADEVDHFHVNGVQFVDYARL